MANENVPHNRLDSSPERDLQELAALAREKFAKVSPALIAGAAKACIPPESPEAEGSLAVALLALQGAKLTAEEVHVFVETIQHLRYGREVVWGPVSQALEALEVRLAGDPAAERPREAKKRHKHREAEEEDERKTRQVSLFTDGQILLEQIQVDGKGLFVKFDVASDQAEIVSSWELEDEILEPISGDDVELGAVKLPSGVVEHEGTLTLLAELGRHIEKYLDVPGDYRRFAAYYIILSWVYDRFHTIPYLRALGDTGCGKSRFLDVIGGLCYKAISASGCVTPAPIYRMLRKWGGTLVLDEADMKNSDEYNEVITILNCASSEAGR